MVLDLMLPEAPNWQTLKQKAEEGAHEAQENKSTSAVNNLPKGLIRKETVVEEQYSDFDGGHHPDPSHLLGVQPLQRNYELVDERNFEVEWLSLRAGTLR